MHKFDERLNNSLDTLDHLLVSSFYLLSNHDSLLILLSCDFLNFLKSSTNSSFCSSNAIILCFISASFLFLWNKIHACAILTNAGCDCLVVIACYNYASTFLLNSSFHLFSKNLLNIGWFVGCEAYGNAK